MIASLLLVLAAPLAPGPEVGAGQDADRRDVGLVVPPEVRVETIDGRHWYTVRAQNASAERVLDRLAALSGRYVEGLDGMERPALVTVDLSRRPLDQVLEYTLGSLGLRYELRRDAVVVLPSATLATGVDERLNLASAAWLRASTRFPDHPAAASARMAQGEIAGLRELDSAARDHYLTLVEDYPRSPLAGEAIMRAGRISARMGQWGEAARLFRTLANLETAPDFHALARLEWARAMVEQGDPEAALHMLSALAHNYPTADPVERSARSLVRARALNAREHYVEALEEIDGADADLDELGAREVLTIRAVALEGIGLPGEAARAWLVFAETARGQEKVYALEEAARLTLEDGDELATLFVVRQAEEDGIAGLEPFEREARTRLGFEVEPPAVSVEERLDRAELALDDEDLGRAIEILEPLFLSSEGLDEEIAARVSVGWARCVEQRDGLDVAVQLLAGARKGFASLEARRRLDVGAAGLFERNSRFEEAIDAYGGRYGQP